jgi:hypothetical protein
MLKEVNKMTAYYITRTVIAIILGGLFALLGAPWWMALLAGVLALAFFIYAPLSGRYTVQPEKNAAALGRDEFTRSVTDKSGRNAFAFMEIVLGGIIIYAMVTYQDVVSVSALSVLLALGVIVFFVSDFWMRRM